MLRAAPAAAPTVQFSDHIVGKGPTVFREACRAGLEGIISKRANSRYEARRSASWLKVKCTRRQEFVVGGFTAPSGSRTGFGALLLGYYDERGHLIYCGRVGAGFSDRSLGDLHRQLRERFASSPPFENPQADPDERSVQWVRPDLVVEVEFSGMTEEGLLRHAVFRGVRKDKSAAKVVLERPEQVAGERTRAAAKVVRAPSARTMRCVDGVRLSHPQRTVYPEDNVTKLDVAEYYRKIADRVLPHVTRRPLSLVRCPLGLAGDSFFQRSVGEGFPDAIRGIGAGGDDAQNDTPDEPPDDTRVPYLLIDDLTGLLSLVQMGVLEIHTWGCRADDLERPDELVFDLDPGPGIGWEDVVESARFLHGYLDRIGLRSFVKTSGGKGIHLLIPLVRRSSWDDVKAFARAVATDLVRIAPRNFVATSTKSLRRNRIYVDYLRNHRGATTVAPYSTRARSARASRRH